MDFNLCFELLEISEAGGTRHWALQAASCFLQEHNICSTSGDTVENAGRSHWSFWIVGLMAQLGVKDFGKNGGTHSKNCVSYVCAYHIALDTTKTAESCLVSAPQLWFLLHDMAQTSQAKNSLFERLSHTSDSQTCSMEHPNTRKQKI